MLERLGRPEPAVNAARRATRKESTNWKTWLVLSRLEAEAGNAQAAVDAYLEGRREPIRDLPPVSAQTAAMPRLLAAAVVLVAAGVVLVLEILAVRLAAPYVGLTLETYSAAIGSRCWGSPPGRGSVGSWPTSSTRGRRGPTLIVAGVLVLLARPIVDGLGPRLEDGGSLATLAVVGRGAARDPRALDGASGGGEAAARRARAHRRDGGRALGGRTLGALGGTLLTGFVLLGELSTREIALGAGLLVVGLGVVVSVTLRRSGPTAWS